MHTLSRFAAVTGAIGAAVLFSSAAYADVVKPISAVASTAFPGYGAAFAIDSSPNTDWAINAGSPVGQTLELTFASPVSIASVVTTDRVTDGGSQGSFAGGLGAFTTAFTLTTFSDASFTTVTGTFNETATAPSSPSSAADFQTTSILGGIVSQYLEYTITAAGPGGAGLSDIYVNSAPVPEPASIALLGMGVAGLVAARRARRQRQAV